MLETKILTKLEKLECYYGQFSEFLPESLQEYQSSFKDQMAIERLFQVSIECMIDICFVLIKYLHLGVPSDEENIFDLLSNEFKNVEKYKDMKRFRNVLLHQYSTIDHALVFKYAHEKIEDFLKFIKEVKQILKKTPKL